jgi:hypothetical protein
MINRNSLNVAIENEGSGLNINALMRALDNTTNSYKYLFFLSLLDHIEKTPIDSKISIPLSELALDMATLAWYPCRYFKLNFGAHDQLPQILQSVGNNFTKRIHGRPILESIRKEIPNHIDHQKLTTALLRYVPFRLIRPFFSSILSDKDHQINRHIQSLSVSLETSESPALYSLHAVDNRYENLTLVLHPRWQALIRRWHFALKSWALFEWANYLQNRNPSMPNVIAKILPPAQRSSTMFNHSKTMWKEAINTTCITCPYSGVNLKNRDFALDHFLPWSYVGHDLPWNLVPTLPAINSSKGAKLPDEKYIPEFVNRQESLLHFARNNFNNEKWLKWTELYCQDLQITSNNLLKSSDLLVSYERYLSPQITLANQLGFECGWTYRI